MAVKVNVSNGGGDFNSTLFIGTASLYPVAVNPTQAQIKELGLGSGEKDPKYMGDDGKFRVDIWMEFKGKNKEGNEVVQKVKFAYFLEPKETNLWIDKAGRFSSDPTNERLQQPIRKALTGEVELRHFVETIANLNQKKNEESHLDTINEIAGGRSVVELAQLIEAAKSQDNFLKGFLYVSEDGKYQRVYTKKLARSWESSAEWIWKEIKRENDGGYALKGIHELTMGNYKNTEFILREYTGGQVGGSAPRGNTPSGGGAANALANGGKPAGQPATPPADDNNPF